MAAYTYRNRLLGQYRASRYIAGPNASAVIPDIANPADPDKSLQLSSTSGVTTVETGSDPKVYLPSGTWLGFDYPEDRLSVQVNKTIIMNGAVRTPGSGGGGNAVVDFFALTPKDDTGDQLAVVVSAAWDQASLTLRIYGQHWDGWAWNSEIFFEISNLGSEIPTEICVSAKHLDGETLDCSVWVPGYPGKKFNFFSYFSTLETLQIGTIDYFVGNRPDIGAPPITEHTLPWAFSSLVEVPSPLHFNQIKELLDADHGAGPLFPWPTANSMTVLSADIFVPGAEVVELEVENAGMMFSPADLQFSIGVIVDPAARSVRERVQIVAVDVIENKVTVYRGRFGDPLRAWLAGAELRGALQPESGVPTPDRFATVAGATSYMTEGSPERVLVQPSVYNMSGSVARFFLPEEFYVTEVGILAASPLTAGTLSLGTPDNPTAYLAAQATPNLEPNGGRWSHRDLLPGKAQKHYLVTLAAGTGVGKPYIKGFFKTFSI